MLKIVLIDSSINNSKQNALSVLQCNKDADIIYTFDYRYRMFISVKDAISYIRDDITAFTSPCAYYDMVLSILNNVRTARSPQVFIASQGIDDCSVLTNEFCFRNYLNHFEIIHPGSLSLVDSASPIPNSRSILDRLNSLSLINLLRLPGVDDEYYDSPDEYMSSQDYEDDDEMLIVL